MLSGSKMRPPSTRSSGCVILTSVLGLILATGPTLAATTLTTSSITRSISSYPSQSTKSTSTVELDKRGAGANANGILLPFFLPDSEPLSLVASVVAVSKTTIIVTKTVVPTNSNSKSSSGQASKTTISTVTTRTTTSLVANTITGTSDPSEITLQIDCPTGSSPENDACRSASIYPAQVTQRLLPAGSEWKGVTTYLVGDDSTTSWTCWQGMTMKNSETVGGGGYGMVPYAQCASTVIKSGGSSVRMRTTTYDECYLYRHMVPLVVTAGRENLPSGAEWERQISAGGGEDSVKDMNAGWAGKMSRLGCGLGGTRTMWAGSVKTSVPVVTGAAAVAGKTTTSGGNAQRGRIWKGVPMVIVGIWWLLFGFASA